MFSAGIFNSATLTFYSSLTGDTASTTNHPQFAGGAIPIACTFDRLYVNAYGVSGVADTITVNLVKNGADTGLVCSVTSATGLQVTCNDTNAAHAVSVVAGDNVALKFVQSTSAPLVRVGVGTRCN